MGLTLNQFDELFGKVRARTADAHDLEMLEPYRVRRAVILAAGTGSRMAPLSYELPKGLLTVKGEVLIERLISQLRAVGVDDICVVVGYMKESFFYLEDRFGVSLVMAEDYDRRASHASVLAAGRHLCDAYVCPSDQYYDENPFCKYSRGSHAVIVEADGSGCLARDKDGFLRKARSGDRRRWKFGGPVFLDSIEACRLQASIESSWNDPGMASKSWEDVCMEGLSSMRIRGVEVRCEIIHEFNRLDDLRSFDCDFMRNLDSTILDNICFALGCDKSSISGITPLKEGLTNLSFRFDCAGETYVYRHPGIGTDEIINRQSETFSLKAARSLGVDETFVYEDPDAGWKLSRYIEGCTPFDYRNEEHVRKALDIMRTLHESNIVSPWNFDFYDKALEIAGLIEQCRYPLPPDFSETLDAARALATIARADGAVPCFCHNDFFGPNLLVKGDDMWLIDWEYAAMGDYAYDIGNFIAQGSGYSVPESLSILKLYFEREPTQREVRHCMACVALVGFYWYVWAIHKEAKGNPVGQWLYVWYRAMKNFGAYAVELNNGIKAKHEARKGVDDGF